MKNIHIRKATRADFDAICRIFEQGDQHHENLLPKYFSVVEKARSLASINSFIESYSAEFFLALRGDLLIGILNLQESQMPKQAFFKASKFALIDSIVVDKNFRKQNIGSLLLQEAKSWASERQLSDIQLVVWEANEPAINFYTKHGFQSLSRRMNLAI